MALGIFSIVALLICFAIHYVQVTYSSHYTPGFAWLMIITILTLIIAVIDAVTIVTGVKAKSIEKKREKSINRLQDKNYVQKLISVGYKVPEKYL